jgi:vancomycin resistance protein VanJ
MRFFRWLSTLYVVLLSIYVLLRFTVGDGLWWLSLLNTFALLLFIPLPLALLGAWLQKIRLLRWLSLALTVVALGWFGQYFLPKSPRTIQGQKVTVMTYNMQAKDENLETFLRKAQPDVVFLQEISSLQASSEPFADIYPFQFAQPEQWGNKVLSKYPILEAEDVQGFGPTRPQRLELDVNGKTIAIYNVHLTWPISNPRLNTSVLPGFIAKAISGFDDRQRNAQIDLLIEHLEKEPLPYLVAGDFNLSQYSATYGKLSSIAQDSFREVAIGLGNTWPATLQSGLNLPPLLRIDYVWHSSHLEAQTVKRETALGSDHFPVIAELIAKDVMVSTP